MNVTEWIHDIFRLGCIRRLRGVDRGVGKKSERQRGVEMVGEDNSTSKQGIAPRNQGSGSKPDPPWHTQKGEKQNIRFLL